ncbi:MAG: hypothetical protein DWI22_22790 [Planctomycetota bacterium]|jgi:hypothetical protein|nr:hypothetical protein [Planctomycetales bacterium]RLT01549.1 MAG: hypothetical protein DWI22_22790 [Planctomycetota bacterium]
MSATPQQIIYSTIPLGQRTDYLPARNDTSKGEIPKAYDAEDFELSDGFADTRDDSSPAEFELEANPKAQPSRPVSVSVSAVSQVPAEPTDGPDKPQQKTPGGRPTPASTRNSASAETSATTGGKLNATDDDLLSIAMQEERELQKRRGDKIADRQRKMMMLHCPCGAWVRVSETQAGKFVRCSQCKQPINVPQIRRKVEKKADKPAVGKLAVKWIENIRFFRIAPTSIVLKPGSIADKFVEADLAFTDSKIVVIAFTGADKKKRGLLGKAPKIDRVEQRKQLREQIAAAGDFSTLTEVEVHSISADQVSEIRLVQPILKAHESMFAGVPVFGDGRIAIFLPIASEGGLQAYCSQSLSTFRALREVLKTNFSLELPAIENGVPEADKSDNLSCFINQSRVESVRNLNYYQQDVAYELELSGYRCKSCTAVISEEGRNKNKLGGTNGKGIAKAKCPKCSGKMGEELLYRIKKSPNADTAGPTPEA